MARTLADDAKVIAGVERGRAEEAERPPLFPAFRVQGCGDSARATRGLLPDALEERRRDAAGRAHDALAVGVVGVRLKARRVHYVGRSV
jgi:hypothetical protein